MAEYYTANTLGAMQVPQYNVAGFNQAITSASNYIGGLQDAEERRKAAEVAAAQQKFQNENATAQLNILKAQEGSRVTKEATEAAEAAALRNIGAGIEYNSDKEAEAQNDADYEAAYGILLRIKDPAQNKIATSIEAQLAQLDTNFKTELADYYTITPDGSSVLKSAQDKPLAAAARASYDTEYNKLQSQLHAIEPERFKKADALEDQWLNVVAKGHGTYAKTGDENTEGNITRKLISQGIAPATAAANAKAFTDTLKTPGATKEQLDNYKTTMDSIDKSEKQASENLAKSMERMAVTKDSKGGYDKPYTLTANETLELLYGPGSTATFTTGKSKQEVAEIMQQAKDELNADYADKGIKLVVTDPIMSAALLNSASGESNAWGSGDTRTSIDAFSKELAAALATKEAAVPTNGPNTQLKYGPTYADASSALSAYYNAQRAAAAARVPATSEFNDTGLGALRARINEINGVSNIPPKEANSFIAPKEVVVAPTQKAKIDKDGTLLIPGYTTVQTNDLVARVREQESANNTNYQINKVTDATGRYQFMPRTAAEYAKKINVAIDPEMAWNDQRQAWLKPANQDKMFNALTVDNVNALMAQGITKPTVFDIYMAHQQGASGYNNIRSTAQGKSTLTPIVRKGILGNFPGTVADRQKFAVAGDTALANAFITKWTERMNVPASPIDGMSDAQLLTFIKNAPNGKQKIEATEQLKRNGAQPFNVFDKVGRWLDSSSDNIPAKAPVYNGIPAAKPPVLVPAVVSNPVQAAVTQPRAQNNFLAVEPVVKAPVINRQVRAQAPVYASQKDSGLNTPSVVVDYVGANNANNLIDFSASTSKSMKIKNIIDSGMTPRVKVLKLMEAGLTQAQAQATIKQ